MVSRSTSGLEAPAGQHQSTNATAPTKRAKQQKAIHRTTPNANPTSGLAPWLRVAGLTEVLLGAPIENVNAPCTGCESAEITCQPTVYVPPPRPGSNPTVICCGTVPWTVLPSSARWPLGANTRRLSGLTPTASSNVALTEVGALARIAPSGGLVDSSVAWARAAVAVPSTPIAARNRATSRLTTRRFMSAAVSDGSGGGCLCPCAWALPAREAPTVEAAGPAWRPPPWPGPA